jgi:hypothetical protein
MKHTKEQIVSKAKQIMKDLDGQFYIDDCVEEALFLKDEPIEFGNSEGKLRDQWVVLVKAIFDNSDHLYI